jgi:glycosyltransferase involved in cell wall biosynthesis
MPSVLIMGLQYKPNKKLKVAIVHDVLIEYGGSERVVEELTNIFPNFDLYTFYYNHKNRKINETFRNLHPRTSPFQHIPFLYKLGRYFSIMKLFSWLYFYLLDLSEYDLIISSSHSYNSKIVRTNEESTHISYIHTPPRYLLKERNELLWVKRFPFNFFLYPIFASLRYIDKIAAQGPDFIVVNSNEVKKRVKKYYGRNSTVIQPPVGVPEKPVNKSEKYYLVISRLVRQKGIELAVKTCTTYSLPLVVVGEGYMRPYLQKIAGPSVTFLGWVKDEDISGLFRAAKALLYCSVDEDFGIVPVESMGYGVPVIAYKSGGVTETVFDGKTGLFFSEYKKESLYDAMMKFEKLKFSSKTCNNYAKRFSKEEFSKKIDNFVKNVLYEEK